MGEVERERHFGGLIDVKWRAYKLERVLRKIIRRILYPCVRKTNRKIPLINRMHSTSINALRLVLPYRC